MIKQSRRIEDAINLIKSLKGAELDVTINLGRNKTAKYTGTLTGVYPALFTVSPSAAFKGKTSFSYSELLCGSVKLRPRSKTSKKTVESG